MVAIQRLDRQIRAANDDGKLVVLTVYHSLPDWCIGVAPGTADPAGRPYSQAYPDPSSGKPWSWLIAYLFARYRQGAAANNPGPGQPGSNQYGNPYGAWAYMVEFTNEPNFFCWPQVVSGVGNYGCMMAQMFKTAEDCSYFWAGTGPPYILGPGVLDADGNGSTKIGWRDYTNATVAALAGWQPRKYVGWSLHNYGDVPEHHDGYYARTVIQLLYNGGWKGGTDGNIFITEAGLNMAGRRAGTSQFYSTPGGDASSAAETDQVNYNHDTYTAMYNTPQAYVWLNHCVNDAQYTNFISGVRRAWDGAAHAPGAPRPYSAMWQQLGVA